MEKKYIGLRFIVPEMHILIIESGKYFKKLSFESINEFIDIFNKYAKQNGSNVEASFSDELFEWRCSIDYTVEHDYIFIKNIARTKFVLDYIYLTPLYKKVNDIFENENFKKEINDVLNRETKRQLYEVALDKWTKSSKRLKNAEINLEKAKEENPKRVNYYETHVSKLKEENDQNYFHQIRLGYESCNHVLVENADDTPIQINKDPEFHRPRFVYRCIKCGLTNQFRVDNNPDYYGKVAKIMYELTDPLEDFDNFVYSELNNSYVRSRKGEAEEIYKDMMERPSLYKRNSEIINELRKRVIDRENGSSRTRSNNSGKR